MIRPGFLSTSERQDLFACVHSHREDHGVARRANAILLLDDGESCTQIAKFLYWDDDTIRCWYKTEVVLVIRPISSQFKVDQGFI